MSLILLLWIAIVAILSFTNFRMGLAAYMLYLFLVPYMSLNIGGFTFGWNYVNAIVILGFYLYWKKNNKNHIRLDIAPFRPFLFYFIIIFIITFFQNKTPWNIQFTVWYQTLFQTLPLPIILWNTVRIAPRSLITYRKIVLFSIAIAIVYGLLLTTMGGHNPYLEAVTAANNAEFNFEYSQGADSGRKFGRIYSCFVHPMAFGLFLGLSAIYAFFMRKIIGERVFRILLVVIVLDILFCGVRTVIAGVSIAIAYYLLRTIKFVDVFKITIVLGITYFIVVHVPYLNEYIGSIFDSSGSGEVRGSSLEMRLIQLEGCFLEIKDNLFLGNGYGWVNMYTTMYGDHPIILAFESLIFVVLCNNGLLGIIIWIIFILGMLYNNKKIFYNNRHILNTLVVFYIAYSCITGEYLYMKLVLLIYTAIIIENRPPKKVNLWRIKS